jgi:hypothetical protein
MGIYMCIYININTYVYEKVCLISLSEVSD